MATASAMWNGSNWRMKEERLAEMEDGVRLWVLEGAWRPVGSCTGISSQRTVSRVRATIDQQLTPPPPVFLDESQTKVKLGDFGLSKNLGGNKFTKTYVGVREVDTARFEVMLTTCGRHHSICRQKFSLSPSTERNPTFGAWAA